MFSKKQKNPRLYYVAIDDEGIDKHISKIIIRAKDKLDSFKHQLSATQVILSDDDFTDLYKLLIDLKQDVKKLHEDLDTITGIELHNSQYFVVKDKSFLEDKKKQLNNMFQEIDSLTQIIEQRPSANEMKQDLLDKMESQVDIISSSIDAILKDDFNLRRIYKSISNL
ncbi:MAG: hypothetical protein ACQESC_02850 [Nanobdellota archaeon]